MKTIYILLGSLAISSITAFAAPKKAVKAIPAAVPAQQPVYRYNYGMAGCGLGSVVIDEPERQNDKFFQVATSIINVLFGYQTSSITSGTSNCTDAPASVARMEQEVFISANLSSIQKEAAQGSGEHLVAFADVLGCRSQLESFNAMSQSAYTKVFSDNNPKAVLDRYIVELKGNPQLSSSCTRVIY